MIKEFFDRDNPFGYYETQVVSVIKVIPIHFCATLNPKLVLCDMIFDHRFYI